MSDDKADEGLRPALGPTGLSATIREPNVASPAATIREAASPTATLRETTAASGSETKTVREEEGEAVAYATPLPRSLASRFSSYEELPAVGGEADCFIVRDDEGNRQFLKVYRLGVEPKTEILEKLLEADPDHVVRIVDFNCCRERRWWELQEYVTFGTLQAFVRERGGRLSLAVAQSVLEELAPAVDHLHKLGIEHKDLKPENILVRTSEPKLDLVISDFGIASMIDGSVHFTTANRTIRYAPPEAQHGVIVRDKWDYWSLGIMLVEMVSGRHPFADLSEQRVGYQLATISVDDLVPADMDPYWRSLCRGLLRRDPHNRWGHDQCRRWLIARDDPSLIVVEEAPPRESVQAETPSRPSPAFAGVTYNTPEALAAAMAERWDDATAFWQTRQAALFDWLRQDLGLGTIATQLAAFDKDQSRRLAAQVFSVIHVLDPARPLSFQGRAINGDALNEAAIGAAKGKSEDGAFLRLLHAENILAIGMALRPQDKALSAISASWNDAIATFRQLGDQVRTNAQGVEPPSLEPDLLARLLAATTNSKVLDELADEAKRAPTAGGRRVRWYRELAEGSGTNSPAATLLRIALAPEANRQAKELRAGRSARNEALWSHMGGGAIIGVLGGFLWWGGAGAYCSKGNHFCTQFAWQSQTVNPVDLVYGGAAVVAAIAILATVHSRTTSKD